MSLGTEGSLEISPISELFRADRVALWATTYNVDLDLFNGYLLPRLGNSPLNVVVLADRDRLDSTLASLPSERLATVNPVNRRWLLRGIRLGSGLFHPKSYLAVTSRSVTLLVGSGNMSASGLDAGREVFTSFDGNTAHGYAAIRVWLGWMERLVTESEDTMLSERFRHLKARLPQLGRLTEVVDSPLWHNLDRPLGDKFCEQVLDSAENVDELLVTAPFYDKTGDAFDRLLKRLQPAHVSLYTTSTTKIDGIRLVNRLSSTNVEVSVFGYAPDAFTHAKLIGVVIGDRGWLLSGSANLSKAALTLTGGVAGAGNVELGVFASVSERELRQAFQPPEVAVEEHALASLEALTFDAESDEVSDHPEYRITRAAVQPDGRVELDTDPAVHEGLRLADYEGVQPLVVDNRSATTVGTITGPLVYLIDEAGQVVSNHVVVDDPDALAQELQTSQNGHAGNRPPELSQNDLRSPLGRALAHLQSNVVMDVSEVAGKGGSSDATRDEIGEAADDDLWDRLEREKLGQDPRASTYAHLLAHPSGTEVEEPLMGLLDAMRARAPDEASRQTPAHRASSSNTPGKPGTGTPWSSSARVRVRASNVLRRWAAMQTDPRLHWVDPRAPLGNLRLVAATFTELWRTNAEASAEAELSSNDLDDLWLAWLRPIVGTGQRDGWLNHSGLSEDEIQTYLQGDFSRNVAALCWLAIRPGTKRRDRIVQWQPVFKAALDWGLLEEIDENTAEVLVASGHLVTADRVETDLLETIVFIDDELWCKQQTAELDLTNLTLESNNESTLRLHISGIGNPLSDPRVPVLIVSICQYQNPDRVSIFSIDLDWRLSLRTGEPIYFQVSSSAREQAESSPIESTTIDSLVAANGVLADLFAAEERSA